jgi:hypothetical protein
LIRSSLSSSSLMMVSRSATSSRSFSFSRRKSSTWLCSAVLEEVPLATGTAGGGVTEVAGGGGLCWRAGVAGDGERSAGFEIAGMLGSDLRAVSVRGVVTVSDLAGAGVEDAYDLGCTVLPAEDCLVSKLRSTGSAVFPPNHSAALSDASPDGHGGKRSAWNASDCVRQRPNLAHSLSSIAKPLSPCGAQRS